MATAVVKGPSSEYFRDFEKACEAYVVNFFPDFQNWEFGEKTYMFPPCFPCRYIAPVGEASGAMPLTESEEADVKGDDAELQVFRTLDKFGRDKEQPMFVFTQLKFTDFTTEVLSQDLVEELLAGLSPEDRTREIDFLIVHRHVGIILIEVKATKKFRTNHHLEAKQQLDIGERFIRAFLHMQIPLFKVVAMPNVHERGKESEYINLRSPDLENDNELVDFTRWWNKHFIEKNFHPEYEQGLLKLTTVLVGQRASVCATASILDKVFKTINNQGFLRRSFENHRKSQEHQNNTQEPLPHLQRKHTQSRPKSTCKPDLRLHLKQLAT